jgi:hypothetical protein
MDFVLISSKKVLVFSGSTYLLMIGQVLEAIDVLKKNDYHHAAIAIAK